MLSSSRGAVLPGDAIVEGKTIAEWSAEAWQWIYGISTNKSPLLDCDGQWANNNQPGGNVFFIAPVMGLIPPPCERTFVVPENRYLLVPVLSITAENIDTVPPLSVEEWRNALNEVVGPPIELHATIDGVPVPNLTDHRAPSPVFSYDFPDADNTLTVNYLHPISGLVDPILADGYWLMLEPLPLGPHVIRVGGTVKSPYFFPHDIIANITVVPDPNQYVVDNDAIVGGKTIGEWSAEWWQWVFPIATNENPHLETNGAWAHNWQPNGDVFFLGGVPGFSPDTVTRTFTVPADKYLFVPVLIVEVDNIHTSPPLTIEKLREQAAALISNPKELHASIDGIAITNLFAHRALSPVFSTYFTNADNYASLNYDDSIEGLVDPMLSDGYWVMLKPLPPGLHVLRYGGTYSNDSWFPNDIIANITVQRANHPPLADASATDLHVISPDNLAARVRLDGSRSSDADGDPLTFVWLRNGAPFAAGALANAEFPVGRNLVALMVSDDQASATNLITIEVITAGNAVKELIAMVQNAGLPANARQPLLGDLRVAQRAFDRERFDVGFHLLRIFEMKVRRHVLRVNADLGESLLSSAREIIAAVRISTSRQPGKHHQNP